MIRSLALLLVLPAGSAAGQESLDQARAVAGAPAGKPQRLVLADIPKPAGKATTLFDGRTLGDWQPWLGYADPAITYRADSSATPIGTSRDTSGDFAVRNVDGEPAIWIKGETWGSLVHRSDLRDYHLRLQFKWGTHTFAPRKSLPQNNGLLYHTHGRAGEVFGTWRPSAEFEIMRGSTGMIVMVGRQVRAQTNAVVDPALIAPHLRFRLDGRTVEMINGTPTWNVEAAVDAEKPVGEWNTLDLYVLGNRAVHVVNGVPVAEVRDLVVVAPDGSRTPLTHGQIQLQSEGAETWFRRITIEPIRSLPRIVAARD
ncbi:3-keto-disaccharide hydrolase [Sphingomonas sp. HT-1]|uniref:3-keto-disaccharide hydrolase n=1 Tax=unclassified Sphingomonas TaxID=196159 RepID=UPI0002E29C8A|nr:MULTISPECIES: DUF1080 domain-containing protein [unclassified Sphingomonas]KTF70413.1 hypothetical protein ATB93_04020 [Sphingomonas sp. WG]